MKRTLRFTVRRDPQSRICGRLRALAGMLAALVASGRAFISAMAVQAEHSAATFGNWCRPDPFDENWSSSDHDEDEWMTTHVDDADWPGYMEEPRTNPATGLSMSGGIDTGGNPYGWSDWSAGSDHDGL